MHRTFTVAVLFLWLLAHVLGCDGTEHPGGTIGGDGGMGGSPATSTSSSGGSGGGGSGGGGSGGGEGRGGGPAACVAVDDGNPCTDELCDDGQPVHRPTRVGVACSTGGTRCDGRGRCVECLARTDCAGADDPCRPRSCVEGRCAVGVAPEGAACNDGDACTLNDTCRAGACVSGAPLACSGSASCAAGACVAPACAGTLGLPGPQALPNPPVGQQPVSMAAADLNGDGALDVATANAGGSSVSVLLNLGNGAFAAAVDYPVGASAHSLVITDLDGDGAPDLAVATANTGGTVRVLLNRGDGTFAAPVSYAPVLSTESADAGSIAASDLDGDGITDLAVSYSNHMRLLFNRGDGTFTVTLVDELSSLYFPWFTSITTADVDGDGSPDLLIADDDRDVVQVRLNHGDGTFAAPVEYAAGFGPITIAAIDLNGDGHVDLAVTVRSRGVSVLLNHGDGTFAAPETYTTLDTSNSLVASDMNGDGMVDLVCAGRDGVGVLLNHGDGTFSAPVSYAAEAGFIFAVAADLNGDGIHDLAVASSLNSDVTVLLNQGDGTFAAPIDYYAGIQPGSVTAADLNGDGRPDLAVVPRDSREVAVLLNHGDGTFADVAFHGVGERPYAVTAADLNGDGKLDLAVAKAADVSVLLNHGDGTFADVINYGHDDFMSSGSDLVIAADVNGDGSPDLVTHGGGVRVRINQGDGTFFAPAVRYASGAKTRSVVAADLDGDGSLDLAFGKADSPEVGVLLNQVDGTFAGAVDYPAGTSPRSMVTADLNDDGATDIVVVGSSDVSVLFNQGDGVLAAPVSYAAGASPTSVAVSDLNGDGRPDLAVANNARVRAEDEGAGEVSVLFNQGDGTFAAPVRFSAGMSPASIAAADLNGDGRPDLAVANIHESMVSVLINRCLP
ncbi:VCBS repeat-containing protein [Sorangium sp. So ce448]|uniref:FG-GAP repeat domain-containing protein n=1 Tax=Sorangium sp. So ce448 TaxID=3133314 RepID=UPI003F602A5A